MPLHSENKPQSLYFSKALFEGLIFGGAYIRRGLSTEGNLRFKIDWASLIVGSKFTVFALFYFVFEGNFPSTSPQGAYIWRGDLTEGFLRYRFGGLIFGGAYTWRGLFSEFYGTLSSGSSLVTGRTCAIVPVQQHFFSVPYGISTEAHAWHIGKEPTNLMNSRTPRLIHFVEHSTRLYDCKS